MDKYLSIKNTTLVSIADAIRIKKGTTDSIYVSDMAEHINTISTDTPAVVQPLEITESGTYTAPDGVDGYNPITVKIDATASSDVRYVTFMSYDGLVEYGKKAVAVGDDCADPIARGVFSTPTKESDSTLDYRFDNWATEPNGEVNADWYKAIMEDKTVYAHFIPCGGTCGTSARWSLSEDNQTLTISGTGAIKNYTISYGVVNHPWKHVASSVKTIDIQSGITKIGENAFRNLVALTSITFPTSLTAIGDYAFYGCTALKSFTFPDTVTIIEDYVLENCSAITSITIPSSVTKIMVASFRGCSALRSITIPSSVVYIDCNSFTNTGLTSASFGTTSGWKKYYIFGGSSSVSSSTLSSASSAASLLKGLGSNYYLEKS